MRVKIISTSTSIASAALGPRKGLTILLGNFIMDIADETAGRRNPRFASTRRRRALAAALIV